MSNPLSGCVITWLGLLHMDNLAVLWDKILMFNLKNHGCALEIINTKPHKGTQTQNNYSALSFVIQMFQTIWRADSAVCNRLANDSRVWRIKNGGNGFLGMFSLVQRLDFPPVVGYLHLLSVCFRWTCCFYNQLFKVSYHLLWVVIW